MPQNEGKVPSLEGTETFTTRKAQGTPHGIRKRLTSGGNEPISPKFHPQLTSQEHGAVPVPFQALKSLFYTIR